MDDTFVDETEVNVGLGDILLCCDSTTGDCVVGGVSVRFSCDAEIGCGEVKTGLCVNILGTG